FHDAPDGFDADMTLRGGRIFVTTSKKGGAKVRVRVAGEAWDAHLTDDRSELVVEVVPSFEPGTPFQKDGGEMVPVAAAFVITKGTVGLSKAGMKDFGPVVAPRLYAWNSKDGSMKETNERGLLEFFTRFPVLPPDPSGVQQARSQVMQK